MCRRLWGRINVEPPCTANSSTALQLGNNVSSMCVVCCILCAMARCHCRFCFQQRSQATCAHLAAYQTKPALYIRACANPSQQLPCSCARISSRAAFCTLLRKQFRMLH